VATTLLTALANPAASSATDPATAQTAPATAIASAPAADAGLVPAHPGSGTGGDSATGGGLDVGGGSWAGGGAGAQGSGTGGDSATGGGPNVGGGSRAGGGSGARGSGTGGSRGMAWGACPVMPGVVLDPRQECATLRVPLDYRHPRGPRISLAVSRIATARAGLRRGVLFLIPGGPGGAGLARPSTHGVRLPPAVQDRYDLVGFDPRGVGFSSPLSCGFEARDLDPVVFLPWPDADGGISASTQRARRMADACVRNGGPLVRGLSAVGRVPTRGEHRHAGSTRPGATAGVRQPRLRPDGHRLRRRRLARTGPRLRPGCRPGRAAYPLTAGMPANIRPCAFWPYLPAEPPTRIAPRGGAVLMVQNRRDPATPLVGALRMRQALGPRTRMVIVESGGHGAYLANGNVCGDRAVTAFLTDGARPVQPIVSCVNAE
jgi:hypothetical protein